MQQRKSRPNIPSVFGDRDRTQVSQAPTAHPAPLATPNVIPFAKPRAIAALMDDKKVTPLFGREAMPEAKPPGSWGTAAKPQEKNPWAKDMATPPENRKVSANTVAAKVAMIFDFPEITTSRRMLISPSVVRRQD